MINLHEKNHQKSRKFKDFESAFSAQFLRKCPNKFILADAIRDNLLFHKNGSLLADETQRMAEIWHKERVTSNYLCGVGDDRVVDANKKVRSW